MSAVPNGEQQNSTGGGIGQLEGRVPQVLPGTGEGGGEVSMRGCEDGGGEAEAIEGAGETGDAENCDDSAGVVPHGTPALRDSICCCMVLIRWIGDGFGIIIAKNKDSL